MPGTKTSVWLGEEQFAEWKASGRSLTEIVKAGLAALREQGPDDALAVVLERLDAKPDADELRRILRDELARVAGQSHA